MAAAEATRRAAGQAQPLRGPVGQAGGAGEDFGDVTTTRAATARLSLACPTPLKIGVISIGPTLAFNGFLLIHRIWPTEIFMLLKLVSLLLVALPASALPVPFLLSPFGEPDPTLPYSFGEPDPTLPYSRPFGDADPTLPYSRPSKVPHRALEDLVPNGGFCGLTETFGADCEGQVTSCPAAPLIRRPWCGRVRPNLRSLH